MATPPWDAASAPVGDHVGIDAQRVGYCLRAAQIGDKVMCHALLSQIVSALSSPKSHSLCVERLTGWAQNVGMDDQDKNGGPNHLRAWRTFRNLTQSELAERVGTNTNMIGYLESGERGLSAKWLRRLAPALNTTPGMILDHDPHDLDNDILEIWANADSRQKTQIREIARALLATGT
jgi:transcriptional regulator with XRE-family HTH domain